MLKIGDRIKASCILGTIVDKPKGTEDPFAVFIVEGIDTSTRSKTKSKWPFYQKSLTKLTEAEYQYHLIMGKNS